MAIVLKNAYVSLETHGDISAYVREVNLPMDTDALDATCMGMDTKVSVPGLKSAKLTLKVLPDTTGTLDAILWAMYNGQQTLEIDVAPNGSTPAVANPVYTFTVWLKSYPAIQGSVGALHEPTVEFELYSGDVVRSTGA